MKVLISGREVLIDDGDAAILSAHKWNTSASRRTFYVRAMIAGKTVHLHRLLMKPPRGFVVDHVNGNGLDNRRENLRVCTNTENLWNSCRPTRGRSGTLRTRFIGVNRVALNKNGLPPSNPWYACIRVQGEYFHLGVFKTDEEAARAYDAACKQYRGPFARLNFPREGEQSALRLNEDQSRSGGNLVFGKTVQDHGQAGHDAGP